MSTLGKRVWQQCHRGFESLPVRHLVGLQQLLRPDSASWLFWCMWIVSMSHSLALDDARLSEIRQDPFKKAVTDAGEFEPPPSALAAS